MRACCPSGKIPFLSEEETWTLPNAEPETEHEPRRREVELKYVNTNRTTYNQMEIHAKEIGGN